MISCFGLLGAGQAGAKPLQSGHVAGSGGQKEPVPDLPRHCRTGARRRGLYHVRRLARSLRLLVQVLLQGHLPRRLVSPDQTQPSAAWDQP